MWRFPIFWTQQESEQVKPLHVTVVSGLVSDRLWFLIAAPIIESSLAIPMEVQSQIWRVGGRVPEMCWGKNRAVH